MRDIIVTTPKGEIANAAREAREARRFKKSVPRELAPGSRIFYVEDGYVRGFATVERVETSSRLCTTTGREWGEGTYAFMRADSWQWIRPLKMTGFQGYRYDAPPGVEIVGGWLDPKPPC
jgi:hypothetical protein